MYSILMLIVMFIVVAMLWNEGLWGNLLTLINVFLSSLIAFNYFEPLADLFEEQMPSLTYVWDFVALWVLFAVVMLVMRTVTETLSRYKVRFRLPLEIGGNVLFAVLTAWIVVCFTSATLHTAPLARSPLRGSFAQSPQASNFFGMVAPDRKWLSFVQKSSHGAFSQGDAAASSPYAEDEGKRVFDPKGEFIFKYGQRREDLEEKLRREGRMSVGGR